MLYAIAFILLTLAVVLLYAVPAASSLKNAARGGFLMSLLLYIVSFLLGEGSWWYKLIFILPRDLTIFTVLLLVVNKFAPRPKWLYFVFALMAFAGYVFYERWSESFALKPDGTSEFLVDARDGVSAEAIQTAALLFDGKAVRAFPEIGNPLDTFLDDYWLIDIPSQYALMYRFIMKQYRDSGLFDDVEFNDALFAGPLKVGSPGTGFDFGVSDPQASAQWALEALGGKQWFSFIENAPAPGKSALLAILDTGTDAAHEDLNGRVSGSEEATRDAHGHGTHVAGIAAAITGNDVGIASLPSRRELVNVLAINVLDARGSGTEASVINGILAAADAGADVISMSLGGPTRDRYQRAVEEAVAYAARRGAITVVAAGNDSGDAARYVPANAKGVITVTALDINLQKAGFSNTVNNVSMGIAAPGVDILSTIPSNRYAVFSGTSMATPYAASLAAIAKAYNPDLDARALWLLMVKNGRTTHDTDATGVFIQPEATIRAITGTSSNEF
jgi:thermitase